MAVEPGSHSRSDKPDMWTRVPHCPPLLREMGFADYSVLGVRLDGEMFVAPGGIPTFENHERWSTKRERTL